MKTVRLCREKYWLAVVLLIALGCLVWQLSQSGTEASFSQSLTYSKTSVLGTNIGNLDANQLNDRLTQLKSKFEAQKISLVNDKKQWVFNPSKLGVTFDVQSTNRAVWRLNSLSLADRYQLLINGIGSEIVPTIVVNSEKCVKSLSVISIPPVEPVSAVFAFEQELKITADTPGSQFSAATNCQKLPEQLATNLFTFNVFLDTTPATITKADLESKLPQIKAIISEPLTLTKDTYSQTLTTEQLLALLEVTKNGSDVQIGWSTTKLDELINNIATTVDTYNASPALGNCQSVVSVGGYWLDKVATKQIFEGLATNSSRSYALPITYHEPVIKNITPVAPGNNGTVYLTFDDGLTFGNQIMNYAACYGVKVTFFELGPRVGTDAAALQRAIAEGHAVQAHGYEHAAYDYGQRSYDWQYNDIKQSVDAITGVTGVRPTYFRPPGGNRSDNTYKAAADNGLKLILWGVSSIDTSSTDTAGICANVLNGAYAGASVLMHSTKQKTADAVPCIVEGLAAKGFNMQALR